MAVNLIINKSETENYAHYIAFRVFTFTNDCGIVVSATLKTGVVTRENFGK